jgi:hypothetical protein
MALYLVKQRNNFTFTFLQYETKQQKAKIHVRNIQRAVYGYL